MTSIGVPMMVACRTSTRKRIITTLTSGKEGSDTSEQVTGNIFPWHYEYT